MLARAGRTGLLPLLLVTLASVPAHASKVIKVEIAKLVYTPAAITAHVGDTIEWDNHGFLAHTSTARNGDFDVMIPAHKSASTVLKHAGTIDYYCRFHPNMTGKITVAP